MHHRAVVVVLASLALASVAVVAMAEPDPGPDPAPRPARAYPRLVLAAGPIVGPHAQGNVECRSEEARCEHKGAFLGVGAHAELRARVWRPLYVHARPFVVGNASKNEHVYAGAWGVGIGFGYYHRRAFVRAEYTFLDAFGSDTFEPPFGEGQVARERWSNHAAMIAAGFRVPVQRRHAMEAWGGVMIGPHAVRRFPQTEPDPRTLVSFMVGLNFATNLLGPHDDTPPRRRKPRG